MKSFPKYTTLEFSLLCWLTISFSFKNNVEYYGIEPPLISNLYQIHDVKFSNSESSMTIVCFISLEGSSNFIFPCNVVCTSYIEGCQSGFCWRHERTILISCNTSISSSLNKLIDGSIKSLRFPSLYNIHAYKNQINQ